MARVRAQTSAALGTLDRASAQLQQLPHDLAGPTFDGGNAAAAAPESAVASGAAGLTGSAPMARLGGAAHVQASPPAQARNGFAGNSVQRSEGAHVAAGAALDALQGLNMSDEAVGHNAFEDAESRLSSWHDS